ncbi:Tumor necrosis factor alpha-induced protein 2 [Liparis tanakae]|uniref:Tumor necrosis factor alpha-induced protein 2 n=1 Tax=Liparis tanakae TaxID=230148 RepID=A0A4Z2EYM9_9TELE|nr:Tumor necrosis factor alpha-induced protein 2 [Liparis tanakae]
MESPLKASAPQPGRSSIQEGVCSMGRQLREDLLHVARVVRGCYPPNLDVCNLYARLYHHAFSARVAKVADFGLEDQDCTFLLQWVHQYYPQVLQKPELSSEMDVDSLGKLLPEELLRPLEDQYLSKQQVELTTFVGRVLEEARQSWSKGEEPIREDGCFVSPVAYDVIQLINGMVTSAETVVGDLHKAQSITSQLEGLLQRFQMFQDEVMKQNRPNSRPAVKAHLGCIQQFRDVLQKKSRLFGQEVQQSCLQLLAHMESSAHLYLLKPVHAALKPQYRKLGTNDWFKKPLFEKMLPAIEEELQGLQGSIGCCHQELVGRLHQEVTVEYVRRLLRGQVKLRDKEEQLKASATVKDQAESLHHLFLKMGSQEVHLKDILTNIAEVLKLQDLPAIQVQVASLGAEHPDLSENHVSALLKLKTTLSKADRKTIRDILLDSRGPQSDGDAVRPFFSGVLIK